MRATCSRRCRCMPTSGSGCGGRIDEEGCARMPLEVYDSGKHSRSGCPRRGARGVQVALRRRGAHAEIRPRPTHGALGAGSGAVRWAYALWRGVSRSGRRLLRPPPIQAVSARWLRQETYRAGQRGIDGPVWPWPLTTTKAPTAAASRSSHPVGRREEGA
jgi:hypothetical protein